MTYVRATETKGALSILIFHRVLPAADDLLPGEMDAARFDELMGHIREAIQVLPYRIAVAELSLAHFPSVRIRHFDDGYADNLVHRGADPTPPWCPATVFIATAYLDGGCMWNDIVIDACRRTQRDEIDLAFVGLGTRRVDCMANRRALVGDLLGKMKYLDLETRDEMARKVAIAADVDRPREMMLSSAALGAFSGYGIEIGAHTRRHPILARTPESAAWDEIAEGRRELAQLLGKPVTLFAYPNGKPGTDYTAEHVRMVREAGFEGAVSTAWGAASSQSDFFQLPRFTPWRTDSLRFDLLLAKNLRRGCEERAV